MSLEDNLLVNQDVIMTFLSTLFQVNLFYIYFFNSAGCALQ